MANYNQGGDDFTKAFFAEDKEICERVHQGMRSQFGRGVKLTDMERVVVDFHQFWATRLDSMPSTQFFEESEQAVRFVK
jgi:phenylpropionate dioxygenase-like ring-hydroxylating dioxygenase large terminal subunit